MFRKKPLFICKQCRYFCTPKQGGQLDYYKIHFQVPQEHKNFFADLAKKLRIENWQDWYSISYDDIKQRGGSGLLANYNQSSVKAIMNILPEYPWKPWKFKGLRFFWKHPQNLKLFFDDLKDENKFSSLDDFYKVSREVINSHGGKHIFYLHNESLYEALKIAYPNHNWKAWRFIHFTLDEKFWEKFPLQVSFLDDLGNYLNFSKIEDYYSLKEDDIIRMKGKKLLEKYQNSIPQLVTTIYKDKHDWAYWRFQSLTPSQRRDYWKDQKHHRLFLDALRKYRGLLTWEDCYGIQKGDVEEFQGSELVYLYENSVPKMVTSIYEGEYPWIFYKFRMGTGYWKELNNRRKFFDDLFQYMGYEKWTDWYKLRAADVEHFGGTGMVLTFYENSYLVALTTLYPEYPWQVWKFHKVPRGYWDVEENVKTFLKTVTKEFGIVHLDDWYSISNQEFTEAGGFMLLDKYGGLIPLLKQYYPSHPWDLSKKVSSASKGQSFLFRIIREMFPEAEDIQVNYFHPKLKYSGSGEPMELDIFIPSLSLAFEYQGSQHYVEQTIGYSADQKHRDIEKKKACKEVGITLIEVPYFWDRSVESLKATIAQSRPELMKQSKGLPIGVFNPPVVNKFM